MKVCETEPLFHHQITQASRPTVADILFYIALINANVNAMALREGAWPNEAHSPTHTSRDA